MATPDLKDVFPDGGKWRASVVKRLKSEGLIVAESVVKSCRLHRNAGYLTLWRLIDRDAAKRRRAELFAELQKKAGESAGTDSPAVNSSALTTNGVNEHGQAA